MKTIKRNNRGGFTLAEVLISLAIMAGLLASVAVAMKGACTSYTENCEIAECNQAARVVLNRMMGEVRTAKNATAPSGTQLWITPPDGGSVTLIKYELVNGELFYRSTSGGVETSNKLIASTEDLKITGLGISVVASAGLAQSVTATLSLTMGGNPLQITASACPRANVPF